MKWLKHMTASWDDEKLAQLVGGGGMEGLALYGLYWRLLEVVAAQMEGKDPSCSVQYPLTRWSLLLSLRGSLVFSTLSRLAVSGVVTVERHGSDIRVTIPNLLKYRDEYSKKSGHTPDNIPPRTEEEGEGEQKQKQITPLLGQARAIDPDVAVYLAYPRHVGKRKAVTQIGLAVKRIVGGETGPPMEAMEARRWLWKRVAVYARSPVARDEQFVPHPATWFSQSRYLDDDREWQQERRQGSEGYYDKLKRELEADEAELDAVGSGPAS